MGKARCALLFLFYIPSDSSNYRRFSIFRSTLKHPFLNA